MMRVPNDEKFFLDLILQRTGFLVSSGHGHLVNEWTRTGSIEGMKLLLKDEKWKKEFLNDCLKSSDQDAKLIISSLSKLPKNPVIASIGPGNCFVELLISRILNPSLLILIDIEDSPNHHHGFADNGSGYCSLGKSYDFLKDNFINNTSDDSLKSPSILLTNPKSNHLPHIEFDLCISLISAGFHYPITQYLHYFADNWSSKGQLIFDARNPQQSALEIQKLPFSISMRKPLVVNKKMSRLSFERP